MKSIEGNILTIDTPCGVQCFLSSTKLYHYCDDGYTLTGTYNQSCDATKNSTNGTFSGTAAACVAAPAPNIQSAVFSGEHGVDLVVTFTAATAEGDAAVTSAPGSIPDRYDLCKRLFRDSTALLGSEQALPTCKWVDAKTVRVTLGYGADLRPGQNLTLARKAAKAVVRYAPDVFSDPKSHVAVTASRQLLKRNLSATIRMPAVIGQCEELTVGTVVSGPVGVESISYSWKSSWTAPGTSSPLVDLGTGGHLRVSSALLPVRTGLTITLTISNMFGMSFTTSASFDKVDEVKPSVLIPTGASLTVTTEQVLSVRATVWFPPTVCGSAAASATPSKDVQRVWWTMTNSTSTWRPWQANASSPRAATLPYAGSVSESRDRAVLQMGSKSLRAGNGYTCMVTVELVRNGETSTASATVHITVLKSKLKAVMSLETVFEDVGGALVKSSSVLSVGSVMAVGQYQLVSFNGLKSSDPDAPAAVVGGDDGATGEAGILYEWSCARTDGLDVNDTSCKSSNGGIINMAAFNTTAKFTATNFLANSINKLTLSVYPYPETNSSRARVASTSIVVKSIASSSETIPVVRIDPLPFTKAAQDQQVVLSGRVVAEDDTVTMQWSSSDVDMSDLRLFVHPLTNTPQLVLKAGKLTAGETYSFTLTAGLGTSSITFTVNTAPVAGSLALAPTTGTRATTFEASAINYVDRENDLPLRYGFFYTTAPFAPAAPVTKSKAGGGGAGKTGAAAPAEVYVKANMVSQASFVPLGDITQNTQSRFLLAGPAQNQGDETGLLYYVSVRAMDDLGASTFDYGQINVIRAEADNNSTVLLDSVDSLVDTISVEGQSGTAVLNLLGTLGASLNDVSATPTASSSAGKVAGKEGGTDAGTGTKSKSKSGSSDTGDAAAAAAKKEQEKANVRRIRGKLLDIVLKAHASMPVTSASVDQTVEVLAQIASSADLDSAGVSVATDLASRLCTNGLALINAPVATAAGTINVANSGGVGANLVHKVSGVLSNTIAALHSGTATLMIGAKTKNSGKEAAADKAATPAAGVKSGTKTSGTGVPTGPASQATGGVAASGGGGTVGATSGTSAGSSKAAPGATNDGAGGAAAKDDGASKGGGASKDGAKGDTSGGAGAKGVSKAGGGKLLRRLAVNTTGANATSSGGPTTVQPAVAIPLTVEEERELTLLRTMQDLATVALGSAVVGDPAVEVHTNYIQMTLERQYLAGLGGKLIYVPAPSSAAGAHHVHEKSVQVAFPGAGHLAGGLVAGGLHHIPENQLNVTAFDVVVISWIERIHPWVLQDMTGPTYDREHKNAATTSVELRLPKSTEALDISLPETQPIYVILPVHAEPRFKGTQVGEDIGLGTKDAVEQEDQDNAIKSCGSHAQTKIYRNPKTNESNVVVLCPECHYFNKTAKAWSRDAVTSGVSLFKIAQGWAFCKTTHLSDFTVSLDSHKAPPRKKLNVTVPLTVEQLIKRRRQEMFDGYHLAVILIAVFTAVLLGMAGDSWHQSKWHRYVNLEARWANRGGLSLLSEVFPGSAWVREHYTEPLASVPTIAHRGDNSGWAAANKVRAAAAVSHLSHAPSSGGTFVANPMVVDAKVADADDPTAPSSFHHLLDDIIDVDELNALQLVPHGGDTLSAEELFDEDDSSSMILDDEEDQTDQFDYVNNTRAAAPTASQTTTHSATMRANPLSGPNSAPSPYNGVSIEMTAVAQQVQGGTRTAGRQRRATYGTPMSPSTAVMPTKTPKGWDGGFDDEKDDDDDDEFDEFEDQAKGKGKKRRVRFDRQARRRRDNGECGCCDCSSSTGLGWACGEWSYVLNTRHECWSICHSRGGSRLWFGPVHRMILALGLFIAHLALATMLGHHDRILVDYSRTTAAGDPLRFRVCNGSTVPIAATVVQQVVATVVDKNSSMAGGFLKTKAAGGGSAAGKGKKGSAPSSVAANVTSAINCTNATKHLGVNCTLNVTDGSLTASSSSDTGDGRLDNGCEDWGKIMLAVFLSVLIIQAVGEIAYALLWCQGRCRGRRLAMEDRRALRKFFPTPREEMAHVNDVIEDELRLGASGFEDVICASACGMCCHLERVETPDGSKRRVIVPPKIVPTVYGLLFWLLSTAGFGYCVAYGLDYITMVSYKPAAMRRTPNGWQLKGNKSNVIIEFFVEDQQFVRVRVRRRSAVFGRDCG